MHLEACLGLGILLMAFGAYVLLKMHWPRRWETAEGTVEKQSDGEHPTYCVKTDDGQTGWTPYFRGEEESLQEGSRVSVMYYKKRNGDTVVVPRDMETGFLVTDRHAVIALLIGAANILVYAFV